MKSFVASLLCVISLGVISRASAADTPATAGVYELRVYHTHPGKMPDMLKRFREHTTALFEKHGMVNVGYWLPVEEKDQDKLYYVLKYPSRDAAKASWKAFGTDPEWIKVRDASEAAGKIVAKVDSTYLAATDYTPATIPALSGTHAYELRIYTTLDNKLADLDGRFRNHTMALFKKHGMTNVLYTHPTDADKGAANTLVYFLAHDSKAAGLQSFDAFRVDPDWIKARDASEAAGKIVSKVESIYLTPTDFSALK